MTYWVKCSNLFSRKHSGDLKVHLRVGCVLEIIVCCLYLDNKRVRKKALRYLFRIGSWGVETKYLNSSDRSDQSNGHNWCPDLQKTVWAYNNNWNCQEKKLAQILTGNLWICLDFRQYWSDFVLCQAAIVKYCKPWYSTYYAIRGWDKNAGWHHCYCSGGQ